jgi:predicted MPP superfamily phosphohydrolase
VRTLTGAVVDGFYFISAPWLGYIYLLISFVLVYEIMHFATKYDSRVVLGSLLFIAFTLGSYALMQGRMLTTKTYTLTAQDLNEPLRIVHLSDMHVGTVHQRKYLTEIVEKTNELKPDIVLVTGDLFDGSAEIDASILLPLNDLTARSFFSNGNHELYEGLDRVRTTLQDLDLELLENKAVEYKGVQIIGVNDKQSLSKEQTLGSILAGLPRNENQPRLLMYHSPSDWSVAKEQGVTMMFSGHTHNGQIFPFTLLVRIFFRYINGLYEDSGSYLHVSPGTGTWGPPMRLGSHNQITVFDLQPGK